MEINQASPKFQDESLAPMHSAEHLLNQTMVRMFGCERSHNAHIERKKSKVNYTLQRKPTPEEVAAVEQRMNEIIARDLPVTYETMNRNNLPPGVPTDRLPEGTGDTVRVVRIGDYDTCACIGRHVARTSDIGTFRITSTSYRDGDFRIVFKLTQE